MSVGRWLRKWAGLLLWTLNYVTSVPPGALGLLQELRDRSEQEIPLSWQRDVVQTSAIEVYSAGTLAAMGVITSDYRKPDGNDAGQRILDSLRLGFIHTAAKTSAKVSPHALDAIICLVAAADFLMGKCIPVTDNDLAEKEGWIWVRQPMS